MPTITMGDGAVPVTSATDAGIHCPGGCQRGHKCHVGPRLRAMYKVSTAAIPTHAGRGSERELFA